MLERTACLTGKFHNQTALEIYYRIIQLIYALNIVKKAGCVHNDIHAGNITYVKASTVIEGTFGCYHLFNQPIESLPAGLTLQSRIDAAKQD